MIDGELRKIFRARLPQVDWQAVETAMTGGGVPDSNFCHNRCEGWIEHKATKTWRVKVRPDQVGWIERRLRHGGRVLVAVRHWPPGHDELWLYEGAAIRPLKYGDMREAGPILGMWFNGPGKWDWAAVLRLMMADRRGA